MMMFILIFDVNKINVDKKLHSHNTIQNYERTRAIDG